MSMSSPKITVIIPLYNKRAHIVRTVDSVLAQTVAAGEIIVVDDGSTDGGPNLIANTRGQHIRLVRQLNGGVSAARNRGIAEASCELVAFLDADDTWEPHYIEEILQLEKQFPEADTFGCAYQYKDSETTFRDPKVRFPVKPNAPCLMNNFFEIGARGDLPLMVSTLCVRKHAISHIGLFPEGEAMGEDQDFIARAALHSPIAYTPSVLLFYHQDAENRACKRIIPATECPFSERLTKAAQEMSSKPGLQKAILDYCGAHLLHIASLNIRMGHLAVGRRLLSDERAKRHTWRHAWWRIRIALSHMMQGKRYTKLAA